MQEILSILTIPGEIFILFYFVDVQEWDFILYLGILALAAPTPPSHHGPSVDDALASGTGLEPKAPMVAAPRIKPLLAQPRV